MQQRAEISDNWAVAMTGLDQVQQIQEDEYVFPYHYMDLVNDYERRIGFLHYYNRLNRVKELLGPYKGQSILDAGCGDGRFCYELRLENVRLTGVDFSEKALAFARAFVPGVPFIAGDLRNLELPEKYDGAAMLETVEHIKPDEITSVLKGLASHLKPGAMAVFTVPSVNVPLLPKHYQHFSEESFRTALEPAFDVENILGIDVSDGGGKRAEFKNAVRWAGRKSLLRRIVKGMPDPLLEPERIYREHLTTGPPSLCNNLIAVCRNR
jgi:2-polyprenyl-3-methyl-5-hydroxy-6-metoxy-1,4-benzoquinol methylase